MRKDGGSYAMLFYCPEPVQVSAGSLGSLFLVPGFYIYCGSAFGPGGVRARTEHHRRVSRRPHWHLDYLRPHLLLREVWYTFDKAAREHQWAEQLALLRGASMPFKGFGSSDCGCRSHLIRIGYQPSFTAFRRRMRAHVPDHRSFYRELVGEEEGRGRSG